MATQAHINARIANASDYTLLSGTASVYVGGSMISLPDAPALSSNKALTVRSGAVDPSIRITYHRVAKKLSQSGFYTKSANYVFSQRIIVDVAERTDRLEPFRVRIVDSSIRVTYRPIIKNRSESGFYTRSTNYVFSQRITIFNTKNITIGRLKITDQIPTLQNAQIEVKLVNPALMLPSGISSTLDLNHIIDMEESIHDVGAACHVRVRGTAMNRQTARWKRSGWTGS
ncbi:hypothetical protein B0H14DRAFT_3518778 [Mycena olivaceomarginata]|nr:hypothetical protein B0H14DRAFT_3518778 [Mycena olivaceomarginata]